MRIKMRPLAAMLALTLTAPALAAEPMGYVAPDGVNTTPVTATTPLPVTVTPSSLSGATSSDASGAVTSGGAYQSVFAANTARKGCLIQNPSTATEVLSVKVGAMSSPFTVPVGGTFSWRSAGGLVVTDAITVTAATTAHAFAAISQ